MSRPRKTKTGRGLELFDQHPDWSPYRCAMEARISPSAIYKALREREAALDGTCPTCGQRRPITEAEPAP